MNIVTGVVIATLAFVGYLIFLRKGPAVAPGVTAPVDVVVQTVAVGEEVSRTLSDLKDLNQAVTASADIFRAPTFQNLHDFTVGVPAESFARPNPFTLTEWKIQMKAAEEAAKKKAAKGSGAAAPKVEAKTPAVVTPPESAPIDLGVTGSQGI